MAYKIQKQYRLQGYDYSQNGYYFVTVCIKNREGVFGRILDGKMKLSREGEIVKRLWRQIPKVFKNIRLDAFVVMPDHIHGVLIIRNRKNLIYQIPVKPNAINRVPTDRFKIRNNFMETTKITLGKIMRWYKGKTTFVIRSFHNEFSWQSRFYDRIVRDEISLAQIRKYIKNNPSGWESNLIFQGGKRFC